MVQSTAGHPSSQALLWLFIAGAGAWGVVYAAIAPGGLSWDGFIYKDPAVNWALGHGFTLVSSPSTPGLTPEFPTVPSVYTYLYAGYALAIGVGDYPNVFFDLALSVLRSALLFRLLVLIVLRKAPFPLRASLTVLLIALIPYSAHGDRPEEFSIALLLGALLILLERRQPNAVFAAYLLTGMNLMTLQYGGLLGAGYVSCAAASVRWQQRPTWKYLLEPGVMLQAGCGILLVPAGLMLFNLWVEPRTIERYLTDAFAPETLGAFVGSNRSWLSISLEKFLGGGTSTLNLGLCYLAVGLGTAFYFGAHAWRQPASAPLWIGAVTIGGLTLATVLVFPAKYYYHWVGMISTLALAGVLIAPAPERFYRTGEGFFVATLFVAFFCTPSVLRSVYARTRMMEAYGEATRTTAALCERLEPEGYLSLSLKFYFRFKMRHPKVCDASYLQRDMDKIEYVLMGVSPQTLADLREGKVPPPMPSPVTDSWIPMQTSLVPALSAQLAADSFLRPTDFWNYAFYARKIQPSRAD